LAAATNFNHQNPLQTVKSRIADALKTSYETHKANHIADYQQYFKRVSLDLGTNNSVNFPTDSRLSALRNGNQDPALFALYYQYGRYLLISSSRKGGLPANLQGIWAEGLQVPWNGDYHININAQMNYWHAESTNLSEMHLPFFDYLRNLGPDGRKTAKDMYGLNGEVAHFASDIFYYTEPWGKPQWAMWPTGLAWCTQHIWEHYLYTGDVNFLKEQGYDILKQSSIFFLDWLVKNPKSNLLVSGPSISPENTFRTKDGKIATMVMGPTMDHMIIRELFQNTIGAAKVLKTDEKLVNRLEKALLELTPTQIGSDGRILEWSEELEEAEPGHRHISHLFGLYPGREITPDSKELFEAAKKTIDYRLKHGGGHTGWSRAWIINFYARLQQADKAYEHLNLLLQKSTLNNLLDNHPPFQIDGNFGGTAGITEMLMQSHYKGVDLLPALPKDWVNGQVWGIVARGGFEIDISWQNNRLKEVKIISRLGNPLQLKYRNTAIEMNTKQGSIYRFDENLRLLK
ncbi:glycoside hydrolase family 95 protein, partial [Pseudoxanthomonas sp. SGD-10]